MKFTITKSLYIFMACTISTNLMGLGIPSIYIDPKTDLNQLIKKITPMNIKINKADPDGCDCLPVAGNPDTDFKSGYVTVATDNNNQPVNMAYIKKGKKINPTTGQPNPILIFADNYLGKSGWKCAMNKLSKYFYTIAIDEIGLGDSSKPEPTALDGVGGENGYSYGQQGYFVHEFIASFNFQGPITYVPVDTSTQPVLKMINRYQNQNPNDPVFISKIITVNSSYDPIIGNDPCTLAFLTTDFADFFDSLYQTDPCTALCTLYSIGGGTFGEPECPEAGNQLLQAAINVGATMPKSVYHRLTVQTGTEGVTDLMATTTIPVLYIYSAVNNGFLLYRQAATIAFSGFCRACNAEGCPATFVAPFPDCLFVSLNAKGTPSFRTDKKRFMKIVRDFASGCDQQCCVCEKPIDTPIICPVC